MAEGIIRRHSKGVRRSRVRVADVVPDMKPSSIHREMGRRCARPSRTWPKQSRGGQRQRERWTLERCARQAGKLSLRQQRHGWPRPHGGTFATDLAMRISPPLCADIDRRWTPTYFRSSAAAS